MSRSKGAYIGGFFGSKAQARRVGSAIQEFYGFADLYTDSFASSMDDMDRTATAIHKRRTTTNSASMEVVRRALEMDARPEEVILVVGCTPTPLRQLAYRAVSKTLLMPGRVGMQNALRFYAECTSEIVRHTPGNAKRLLRNKDDNVPIPEGNVFDVAIRAAGLDIPTTLVFATKDEFGFGQNAHDQITEARNHDVDIAYLEGYHDMQLHYPREVHDALQDRRNFVY